SQRHSAADVRVCPVEQAREARAITSELIGQEAVEQAGSACSLQVILAATARAMRGVPRIHVPRIFQAGTVVVADDGRSVFAAFRPVRAGGVAAGCRIEALGI